MSRSHTRIASPLVLLLACAGCGGVDGEEAQLEAAATAADGSLQLDPTTGRRFLVETGALGASPAPEVTGLVWGRRVDVFARNPHNGLRELALRDLVIGPEVADLEGELELSRSLATGGETLTILHPVDSSAFADALALAQAGCVPVDALSEVPRDAALVVVFDDLFDPLAAGAAAVQLEVGGVHVEVDVRADASHGARVEGAFASSRLLVLPADPRGYLTTTGGAPADVRLRLPTRGATGHWTNRSGRGLAAAVGARVDQTSLSRDLVRGFRIGSEGLTDGTAPQVIGRQRGQLTQVRSTVDPMGFVIDFQFTTVACAVALQVGDALRSPGHVAEVLAPSAAPSGGLVQQVRVRLITGNPATYAPAGAELRAAWDPGLGAPPECYVRFSPMAQIPPATGVWTGAAVVVTFSEAMDVSSVQSTGTFRLAHGTPPDPNPLFSHVVGEVTSSVAADEFHFVPSVPLRHVGGLAETYHVELAGGPQGVTDLAGNALAHALPATTFTLTATAPTQTTTGVTLTFEAFDEDGDGADELRGALLYDLSTGSVSGRTVSRFQAAIDTTQPLVSVMPVTPTPLTTPLSPWGSKMMAGWRYIDMGFGLLDPAFHDLDVEGLAWTPWGAAFAETYSEFRMALAHGFHLPDEVINTGLLPSYRFSGVVTTFDQNLLSPVEDPLTVVHAKSKGYTIDPADLYTSASGNPLMPWPMNRNIPPSQYTYWTWRDTAKTALGGATGGASGVGADPQRLMQVTGTGLVGFYPNGNIPTIALPLLTEYRCYPDFGALGVNTFRTSFALNSSFKPTFRAYSTGGPSPIGNKFVDPDNEPVATGGATSSQPIDNVVYHGQAEFVVRVSRGHTRWLDLGAATVFAAAVLEPGPGGLPPGTQATLAFRGAASITASSGAPWLDASLLDPYGDGFSASQLAMLGLTSASFTVVPHPDASWKATLSEIDGARFVQARISLVSNAETDLVPAIAGLGVAGSQ